jgi:serine/threonine protein kinase
VWEADGESLRRAYRVCRLPEVAASPFVHAPVDLIEAFNVYLVSELAETDLGRVLRGGPLDPDELAVLGERLRGALDVLHGLRLVHSDLREDNVFRVGGDWKLGDPGAVVGSTGRSSRCRSAGSTVSAARCWARRPPRRTTFPRSPSSWSTPRAPVLPMETADAR